MLIYSTDISEESILPYTLSILYKVEKYFQESCEQSVFTLVRKDNSKNTSEVAYRKEHNNLHIVNINFNLFISKVQRHIRQGELCLFS